MPKISIIVAVADDLAIGKDNGLLCHIPGDLKRFKELTTGHTVIMGRKTLESLPNGPLPNRRNIVITHSPETLPEGCVSAVSLDDAIAKGAEDDEIFIIGGGQIYSQAIAKADMLYLTCIHSAFPDADTFFTEYNASDYDEVFCERHEPSEKCKYAFSFVNLKKK